MVKVVGTFDRETKRMIRYTTDWGTIYVPKSAFEGIPQKIEIQVTELE